ncbi:thiamine pyrophosphate-binding protein [Streptomyces nitrosporeus]|uniref:thiamine pyrophosphate-binding protein n=1 Tax=Streptomyces nitrosporeus TaxID=28894 RepID=UPI0039A2CE07
MLKVREAVVDSVSSSGSTTVFVLMGAANQELICDLEQRGGLRVVHCRHEAGAVGMADGYARFSHHVGMASVTSGPGVTNTATSLAVAHAHRSPVLLLAGDTAQGDLSNPQRFDQDAFTQLCAGDGGRITSPDQVSGMLHRADSALAASRPFALHLPTDVQEMTARPSSRHTPEPTGHVTSDDAPDHDAMAATAASLLTAADHPVILAGRGALNARTPLVRLAQLLGAPLITTLRAAGLFAGQSLEAGVAGPMGDGRGQRLLEESDAVLAVGTSLHPLAASALLQRRVPPRLIRIDTAPSADHLSYDAYLRTEASLGARSLERALTDRGLDESVPWWRHLVGSTRVHLPTGRTGGVVHPLVALDRLRNLLPEQRLLVIGGGHAALSACQMLPASGPRDFTCVSTDFGAIGQALPVAIGACFARPGQRVYHVTGDGELMMALAELHTAVHYRLPLTIVVLNDHGFGQERHNLHRAGRPGHHADYTGPDLATVANAMGASVYSITRQDELGILSGALGHEHGVVFVDIHIDPAYLNPVSAHVATAITLPRPI